MKLRSLLFVPGDRPERFAKAAACGADAVILDLEDSVAPAAKPAARAAVAAFLAAPCPVRRLVRINPLAAGVLEADLAALAGADAVMLPKCESADDVATLAARLAPGQAVLPIATETPAAIFGLGSYGKVAAHLLGLTWGAEDLPAAIGAAGSRDAQGRLTAPYEMARSLALFAAHAAGTAAIETVYPAIRDEAGLAAWAARAAFDGFTGMMALHPAQVPVINTAFTPSAEAVAHARAVVAAFTAAPEAGVLVVEGRMVDAPHLLQARKLLARAGDTSSA